MGIHRDPKRSRATRVALGIAAVCVVGAGAFVLHADRPPDPQKMNAPPPTLSVLQAGDDKPTDAKAAPQAAPPAPPAPKRSSTAAVRDAEYRRLVAAKSPEAYPLARQCLLEDAVATGPHHINPVQSQCALGQGTWQDRQLRKDAVRAYALAGRFGGVHYLWEERPTGAYGAFADDPEEYEKLVVEAERVGIERGEPVALIGAATTLRRLADTYAAKGDSALAHDAYMESLAMAVGSAAGHAEYNAALAAGSSIRVAPYDPNSDPQVAAYPLSAADRLIAINDGLRRAANWRKQS